MRLVCSHTLYAERRPYRTRVRDGCPGEFGPDYRTCSARRSPRPPLNLRLWSCAPGFTGENDQIKSAIDTVSKAAKKRGIYVIGRGGDREIRFKHPLDNGLRFIVPPIGDRALLWRNKPFIAEKLAAKCRMLDAEAIIYFNINMIFDFALMH